MKQNWILRTVLILVLTVVLVLPCAAAPADQGSCGDNLTWTLEQNGTLQISGTGPMTDFAEFGPWHSHADQITTVEVSSGVTSIGARAFSGCSTLTRAVLPDSLTRIGMEAFLDDMALEDLCLLSKTLTVEQDAFLSCGFHKNIFYAGTDRQDVILEAGNDALMQSYWHYCYGGQPLVSLAAVPADYGTIALPCTRGYLGETLPLTVTPDFTCTLDWVKADVPGCIIEGDSLTLPAETTAATITISARFVPFSYSAIRRQGSCGEHVQYAMFEDEVLYIGGTGPMYDYRLEIQGEDHYPYPNTYQANYPWGYRDSLISFGSDQQWTRTGIRRVYIADGVTEIGRKSFYQLVSLEEIRLPSTLTSIHAGAFYSCTALKSITLPDSLCTIEAEAFSQCTALKAISFPASVRTIGEQAFTQCDGLSSITLNEGLQSIGPNAFSVKERAYRTPLSEIAIPDSVTELGEWAFAFRPVECLRIGNGLTRIPEGCFLNNDPARLFLGSQLRKLGSQALDVADPERSSLQEVFYGGVSKADLDCSRCNSPLPDLTWHVGYAGQEIIPLTLLPTEHGKLVPHFENVFKGETLVVDYVPETGYCLDHIFADYGRTKGNRLTIREAGAFTGVTLGAEFVPCQPGATVIKSGITDTPNQTWMLFDNGVLQIVGGSVIPGTRDGGIFLPWHFYRDRITALVVDDNIQSIGSYAFDDLSNLRQADLGSGVREIGQGAFRNCTSLEQLPTAPAIQSIGFDAFSGCTSLQQVTTPPGLQTIARGTFSGCTGLTSLTLSEGLLSLGDSAFRNCSHLQTVHLPGSLTTLGSMAFSGCAQLQSFTAAADNPRFYALDGVLVETCSAGDRLVSYPPAREASFYQVPQPIMEVAEGAFDHCNLLHYVVLPASLQTGSSNFFCGCANLTDVFLYGWSAPSNAGAPYWHRNYDGSPIVSLETRIDPAHGQLLLPGRYAFQGETFHVQYEPVPGFLPDHLEADNAAAEQLTVTIAPSGDFRSVCLTLICREARPGVQAYDGGACGPTTYWALYNDHVMHLGGWGSPDPDLCYDGPWQGLTSHVRTFLIDEGITDVPAHFIKSSFHSAMLFLPSSLRSIGAYAFNGEFTDVFYTGTSWEQLTINPNNSNLYHSFHKDVYWHYNYNGQPLVALNAGRWVTLPSEVAFMGETMSPASIQDRAGQTFSTLTIDHGTTEGKTFTVADSGSFTSVLVDAVYTQNDYIATFHPEGGTVTPTTKIVHYGEAYGPLPVPVRPGYTFLYWTNNGSYIRETSIHSVALDVDFYASWVRSLTASITNGKVVCSIRPDSLSEDDLITAAFYTDRGQLLQLEQIPVSQQDANHQISISLAEGCASVKVFLCTPDNAPQCSTLELKP